MTLHYPPIQCKPYGDAPIPVGWSGPRLAVTLRRIWTRLVVLIPLLYAALSVVPVNAHSTTELDVWVDEWQEVMAVDVSWPVIADWTDMATRHPTYFGRPVPHTHTARRVVYRAGVEQWRSLVTTYFRPGDVDRALRIMQCESGGNPDAVGKDRDIGLMQHLERYWDNRSARAGWAGASPFDPVANIAVAAWLRDQPGGWGHWSCR